MSSMASLATGASGAGTLFSAISSLVGGDEQYKASLAERTQYYNQGNQAAAISEREAQNVYRTGALVQSRQQAVSAASGAGATDPTVLNIQGETARNTTYGALTKVWEGQTQRDALRYQGDVAVYGGKQALMAGGYDAISTLLGGAKTMFDRYGGGGAGATAGGGMPGADAVTGGSGFDLQAFLAGL